MILFAVPSCSDFGVQLFSTRILSACSETFEAPDASAQATKVSFRAWGLISCVQRCFLFLRPLSCQTSLWSCACMCSCPSYLCSNCSSAWLLVVFHAKRGKAYSHARTSKVLIPGTTSFVIWKARRLRAQVTCFHNQKCGFMFEPANLMRERIL